MNCAKYSLVAFDMDGTLLNKNNEITPVCRRAIRDAFAAGKEVVLCSGRSPSEMVDYFSVLPEVKYIIGENGGILYHVPKDEVICSHPFEKRLAVELSELLVSDEVLAMCMIKGKAHVSDPQCRHVSEYLPAVFQSLFDERMIHIADMKKLIRENADSVEKFNIYCKDESARAAKMDKIKHLREQVCLTNAIGLDIECTQTGVSKGTGLKDIGEYLGIPLTEMIMVGDNINDLKALEAAGLALAMGNAIPEVKDIADHVLPDNEHDGAAYAILQYLLK